MSRSLVVLIPHQLGKPEAIRRQKSGLAGVQQIFLGCWRCRGKCGPRTTAVSRERPRPGRERHDRRHDDRVRLDVMLPG
jgi:hypothetical protein